MRRKKKKGKIMMLGFILVRVLCLYFVNNYSTWWPSLALIIGH